jgi:hypothetical protein
MIPTNEEPCSHDRMEALEIAAEDQPKDVCEVFVRASVPAFAQISSSLPTLPRFRSVRDKSRSRARVRFIEEAQPNWWQARTTLGQSLLGSPEGHAAITAILKSRPFSAIVGKTLMLPQGYGISYDSAEDLVW